jgi:hypothetical protein
MTDPRSTRRAFLGSLAAVAGGVAGCQSPGTTAPERDRPRDVVTGGSERPRGSSRYAEAYRAVAGSVASVRIYGADDRRGQGSAFV